MTMQEHAPAPHMKGVVWEYFRGGNRDGPGHDAGRSSASQSGPAGAGFCPAWAKPGGLGARLGRGRRGGPDRGELSASGEVPEPEEVRASAALVGCSRRAGFWCPRRGACPERWRRWSGARVGVPASGAWAGLPGHPATACPVACLGARGVRRGRGRAAHHDPDSDRPRWRVAVCHGRARVTWPHRRAGCRADDQPGAGRGAGVPPVGGGG